MAIQKEVLRQIIKENDLKSVGDVSALLKESFKDLLQELLEAELDVSLGYDKNQKNAANTDNKDILSITIGANESSRFWLGMLNDLKNRGVQDVLFFCVDGLPGFREAIEAVYPDSQVQRCIIHM